MDTQRYLSRLMLLRANQNRAGAIVILWRARQRVYAGVRENVDKIPQEVI